MGPKGLAGVIGTAVAVTLLQAAPMPLAQAEGCPDAEVIFARGTTEQPGVGPTGQAFVDALRARVGAKSVGVYGVDYPATTAFSTAIDGITDARAHILSTAANCPKTKMVLGGFSQGAAVMGFVTANAVPDGVSPADVPAPMPPEVTDHVAAVVLFGKPSPRFMRAINDPSITIGTQYVSKTVDLCVDNDLICDPHGSSFSAHNQYEDNGTVDQGATYAATQLQAIWAAEAAEATAELPGTALSQQVPISAPVDDSASSQHLPSATHAPPGPIAITPPPAGPLT